MHPCRSADTCAVLRFSATTVRHPFVGLRDRVSSSVAWSRRARPRDSRRHIRQTTAARHVRTRAGRSAMITAGQLRLHAAAAGTQPGPMTHRPGQAASATPRTRLRRLNRRRGRPPPVPLNALKGRLPPGEPGRPQGPETLRYMAGIPEVHRGSANNMLPKAHADGAHPWRWHELLPRRASCWLIRRWDGLFG